MPSRDRPPTDEDARHRQRAGSERGASLVQAEFAAALTRRRFCELVGVHPTTLRRWEAAGVLSPRLETIMRSPTYVFDREDVTFGRRLVVALQEGSGKISVEEAARQVRERGEPASG